MLNDTEFVEWCDRLRLCDPARLLITRIRSSEPARRVTSSGGNVSGQQPSKKMGKSIQFESHTNELPAIYELEADSNVLEFYDQPSQIRLDYQSRKGRRTVLSHIPDYFVMRKDKAGWEECKLERKLVELAEKEPNRYSRGEEGNWRCPPGERYAEQFDLYYRIRSSNDIDWVTLRNRKFLQGYSDAESDTEREDARLSIVNTVSTHPGIALSELFHKTNGVASRDDVYASIASNDVYVDLSAVPLVQPERVHVFMNEEAAVAMANIGQPSRNALSRPINIVEMVFGTKVEWDGKVWNIVNIGETKIGLVGEDDVLFEISRSGFESFVRDSRIKSIPGESARRQHSEVMKRYKAANKEDYQEANRRTALVLSRIRGETLSELIPERTLTHYVKLYKDAEKQFGCGYVGLLPRKRERGNRARKLPEESLTLLQDFIENDYETLKQKSIFAVHQSLKSVCEQRGIIAPSYKTLCIAIKKRPRYEQTLKRKGRRAAYQHEPFHWILEEGTPRHGDRPFEICHLDHTQLDLELISSSSGQSLGRPWVTIIMDAFSRRFLAIYLTFDPPSYRSCMMAFRECVRRFGRFPETIVVDGGAEFSSTYFETLVLRYECTKKTRPPAKSRFGSVCERLFGTTNTQFIHTLRGNTQITRNIRQVTKSVDPKGQAVWTLAELDNRFRQYAYEIYDERLHQTLGQSPRQAFTIGIEQTGARGHRIIPYDEEFLMLSLPTTRKGKAKLVPQRGVKINHIYYWCEAFRNPSIQGTEVDVRYHPFDAGTAFAFVNNEWQTCISEYFLTFRGRSEREMQIAREELLARRKQHSKDSTGSTGALAEFMSSMDGSERFLQQRRRDMENREHIEGFDGRFISNIGNRQLSNIHALDDDGTVVDARPDTADGFDESESVEIYEAF